MKSKFEIAGRPTPEQAIDRFVSGTEPMTTMTVQIPARLKQVLKRAALDRQMTVKAVLIELIEQHVGSTNV